ncbi:hypothetical protein OG352_00630 [Streptomyces sp. NBC_01485]|uniref:hypothetical protein n=1 Tax=Streptomyces sp. NBC_01485 TaxID=2903884 RepID=UPI002E2EEECC|nr:hypothetical protein [Streptomyces sp. NBC_01485]
MSRQVPLVCPEEPDGCRTTGEARAQARSGTVVRIRCRRCDENLTVRHRATLVAEDGPGSVESCPRFGSARGLVGEEATLTGPLLRVGKEDVPVVDAPRGRAAMEGRAVIGTARTAAAARLTGSPAMRGSRVTNPGGAGIVDLSPGGSVIEDCVVVGLGSCAVVIGEQSRSAVQTRRLRDTRGNGVLAELGVLRSGHTVAADAGRPAVVRRRAAARPLVRQRPYHPATAPGDDHTSGQEARRPGRARHRRPAAAAPRRPAGRTAPGDRKGRDHMTTSYRGGEGRPPEPAPGPTPNPLPYHETGASRGHAPGTSSAIGGPRAVPAPFHPAPFHPAAARAAHVAGTVPAEDSPAPEPGEPDTFGPPGSGAPPVRLPPRVGKPALAGAVLLLTLVSGTAVPLAGPALLLSVSAALSGLSGNSVEDRSDNARTVGEDAGTSVTGDKASGEPTASGSATPPAKTHDEKQATGRPASPAASPSGKSGDAHPKQTSAAAPPATTPEPSTPTTVKQWTNLTVHGTSVLTPGQSWRSDRTTLAMTADGDLVIRDENGMVRWSAGTAGRGYKTVFQGDGNFAVYTKDDVTAWSTRTEDHNGAGLVLRADGDVVIVYGDTTVWSAGTAH